MIMKKKTEESAEHGADCGEIFTLVGIMDYMQVKAEETTTRKSESNFTT